jgi:hypothetical protein
MVRCCLSDSGIVVLNTVFEFTVFNTVFEFAVLTLRSGTLA